MHVLVIDDSRVARLAQGRLLRALGFEIVEAANGREGIEELRRRPDVELVLVDGHMPDMDGWAFAKAVRADPACRRVRLLLVSAAQGPGEVRRALDAGADGFLAKPFTTEALHEQLRLLGLCASASNGATAC